MAFSSYSDLKTGVLSWLNRSGDSEAALRVGDWIALAEDELKMAFDRLKLRQNEQKDTNFSLTAEYNTAPIGFYGVRSIKLNTDTPVLLDYVAPQVADRWAISTMTGRPKLYTVQTNMIRVFPAPDINYTATILYYNLPSLSDSNTSNWLLESHPKVYLMAAIAEAFAYYHDKDNAALIRGEVERMLNNLAGVDGAAAQGGSLRVRVDNGTP